MFLTLDPLYWMMLLPCMGLSLLCTLWVKSAFNRYSQVAARNGMTGAQIAKAILQWHGIHDVGIEPSRGFLSDHYDPTEKMLRLSPENHDGRSIAALGVAAHEVGHAIQHAEGYAPLQFRSKLVPLAGLGSNLAWILLILGIAINATGLSIAGVVLFGFAVLFSLVTLPVEFDASARALKTLESGQILAADEMVGARAVLRAAGATYVAAAITSVVTLLYFLLRSGLLGGNDD